MPVGEPVEQRAGLGDLLARDRAARLVEPVAQLARALHHLRPVLDRAADVGQSTSATSSADVVEDAAPVRRSISTCMSDWPAIDRVHEQQHVAPEALQRHPDRVDEERHVVGDDLHDGVGRAPAVLGLGRHERADERRRAGTCSRDRRQSERAAPVSSGTPWARRSSSGTQRYSWRTNVLGVVGVLVGYEPTGPRADGGELTRVTPLLEQGHGAIVTMTSEVGACSQERCYKGVTKSDLPLCSLPSPGCSHPAGVSRST